MLLAVMSLRGPRALCCRSGPFWSILESLCQKWNTWLDTDARRHIHRRTHTHMQTHTTHTQCNHTTCTQTHTHTHRHTCRHTQHTHNAMTQHARRHIRRHTHTHTYTHAHTHTLYRKVGVGGRTVISVVSSIRQYPDLHFY